MLSLLPRVVPFDMRFRMTQNPHKASDPVFMTSVIRRTIPLWFATKLQKVICWGDSATTQAGLNLFPSLQTVALRGRGCEPLRAILRKSEWTTADVQMFAVTNAVQAKSLELLKAATTKYDQRYHGRAFRMMLQLRFGDFYVNVGQRSHEDRDTRW